MIVKNVVRFHLPKKQRRIKNNVVLFVNIHCCIKCAEDPDVGEAKSGGIPPGGIAAIVIAILIAVMSVFLVVVFWRKCRRVKVTDSSLNNSILVF